MACKAVWVWVMWAVWFVPLYALAQQAPLIHFKKLNTNTGLSDNLVNKAMLDKNGLLWMATTEGLNSYDGYTVRTWSEVLDPQLKSRNIRDLYCDSHNNIWVLTPEGKAGWLNKNRLFVPVELPKDLEKTGVQYLLFQEQRGMLLVVDNHILTHSYPAKAFHKISAIPNDWIGGAINHHSTDDTGNIFLAVAAGVLKLDAGTLKASLVLTMPNVTGIVCMGSNKLLISASNPSRLWLADAESGATIQDLSNLADQNGKKVRGFFRKMARLANGDIGLASSRGGYYVFSPVTGKLWNYAFDPLDENSIHNTSPAAVVADTNGNVFITSREAGVAMYNTKATGALVKRHFYDKKRGEIAGGFINKLVTDNTGNLWMGGQNGLVCWNPKTDEVNWHNLKDKDNRPLSENETITGLCFDDKGRLWVGTATSGIMVLDAQLKPVKFLTHQLGHLSSDKVTDLLNGPDSNIWVCTQEGIAVLNSGTFTNMQSKAYPMLSTFSDKYIFSGWVQSAQYLWLGTDSGALRLDMQTKTITKHITTRNGLLQNRVSFLGGDSTGNVYLCSRNGFYKMTAGGKLQFFGTRQGLPNEICLGVETDRNNRVWISNDNYLIRFSPADNKIKVFSGSSGIKAGGFRAGHLQDENGNIYWTCNEGLLYYHPDDLSRETHQPALLITAMHAQQEKYYLTGNVHIGLEPGKNDWGFWLNPIDVFYGRPVRYAYKLLGVDEDWQTGNQVQPYITYQNLRPGKYRLQAKVSEDGKNWVPALNEVQLSLAYAWHQKGWVRLMGLFLFMGLAGYWVDNFYKKRKLAKEANDIEKAVLYLTSTIHSHTQVDALLWDVAKNVIARLGFEDCVIYLIDEDKQALVQKAAWGPKTVTGNRLLNPLEIPIGKGIVGAVAQSGVSAIVPDTTKDERYIEDDAKRYSELCVPIMNDGRVIGVIDSEHGQKHFFQQRHLTILQTISSLLGSKIANIYAAAEKSAAELELVEIRQKSAEVEMQALRAQMNPHFLFNSLNSINNFILNNDVDNASSYLTRFSRLMRLILDNSRYDWVPLEQELHALELYIGMESLRFDHAFTWRMDISQTLKVSGVQIPPLLIQPYVENAIWHGLMHKKTEGGHLQVNLFRNEDKLFAEIEDNGIGRKRAESLKHQLGSGHKKSHGMHITNERIAMINKVYNADVQLTITDKMNEAGEATGTKVFLQMKFRQA